MKFVGLSIMALAGLMVGCSTYYQVTDPASGKLYYTKEVDNAGRAGAIKFKDEKSGGRVTLQSSEVKEISEDQFRAGMAAKPPAAPSPAAPVSAAPAPSAPTSQK